MLYAGIDWGTSAIRSVIGAGGIQTRLADVPIVRYFPKLVEGPVQEYQRLSLKRHIDSTDPVFGGLKAIEQLKRQMAVARESIRHQAPDAVVNCALTAPPLFSQRQRSLLRDVARGAGFERVKLIDDATAALLNCVHEIAGVRELLVLSWGGDICSVGLYRARENGFQIVALEGDRTLGGEDLNWSVAVEVVRILHARGRTATECWDPDFWVRLVALVQDAEAMLSRGEPFCFPVERLFADGGPSQMSGEDIVIEPGIYVQSRASMIERALELTRLAAESQPESKPDAILLVGGMAKVEAVREALYTRFTLPLITSDPSAVLEGALLYSQRLSEREWRDCEQDARGCGAGGPSEEPSRAKPRNSAGRWADNFVPIFDKAQGLWDSGQPELAAEEMVEALREVSKFTDHLCQRTGNPLATLAFGVTEFAKVVLLAAQLAWRNERHKDCYALADQGIRALGILQGAERTNGEILSLFYQLRGAAHASSNRFEDAEKDLGTAVRLNPRNEAAKRDLESVRGALKSEPKTETAPSLGKKAKTGMNDDCPCGSKKKYKRCCGRLT